MSNKVLDASHYGVGQKRERLIIIGMRKDIFGESAVFHYPGQDDHRTILRDILKDVPDSEGQSYSESKRKVMGLVPAGGCWVGLPEEVARDYMGKSHYSGGGKRGIARRLSWDEPSLTITTSSMQKQTERCHPDETRPLTIRESARAQSFPDDWKFVGSISSQYKQIGNAVPVELAHRTGLQIVKTLRDCDVKDV